MSYLYSCCTFPPEIVGNMNIQIFQPQYNCKQPHMPHMCSFHCKYSYQCVTTATATFTTIRWHEGNNCIPAEQTRGLVWHQTLPPLVKGVATRDWQYCHLLICVHACTYVLHMYMALDESLVLMHILCRCLRTGTLVVNNLLPLRSQSEKTTGKNMSPLAAHESRIVCKT